MVVVEVKHPMARHDERDIRAKPGYGGPQRLVVAGVDGSKVSSETLRWAAQEARLRGATLKVVHAWHLPTFGYGAYLATADGGSVDWAKRDSASLEERVAEVLGNDPGMPVIGEVSVSAKVAHHAPCPVAIVHGKV
jgi:nucleotide-binding universal stress UspA family protein